MNRNTKLALQKYPHVFQPLKVKNLLYTNRICSTTMSTVPTHTHLSSTNYGGIGVFDKAQGGAAMIGMMYHGTGGTTHYEANGANPFKDKYQLDVLRESLSVVKAGGALAGMAVGMGNTIDNVIYSPSGLPFARPYSRDTKIIDDEKIQYLLDQCVAKAKAASKFGFDLLILDISNDSIVNAFMAPGFNKRTDKWGGSYENRFRLGHMIVDAVRELIGPHFVLELRVSSTLGVPETYPFEEMLGFIKSVQDKIDIINVITGMDEYHDGNTKLCPPIFEKHMLNLEKGKRIKKECNLVVNLSGSIMNVAEAEEVLASGAADLVLFGRSLVADPYWPKKVLAGREDDIVPCIRCNNCYHIATEHFNTCCTVNPRIYRENRVPLVLPKTASPKNVLIVGGGPAGLKTALTAAQRGHDVTLIDKNEQLGGNMIPASYGELKQDLAAYLTYLRNQISKSKVNILLNMVATPELVSQLKPDVLILAVGASPVVPKIPGIGSKNVYQAIDILNQKLAPAGNEVTILGGGSIGCEIAVELAASGTNINIVEMGQKLAANGNELYRTDLLLKLKELKNIHIYLGARCAEIKDNSSIAEMPDGTQKELKHDTFIVSTGMRNDPESLYRFFGIAADTRYVGDCKKVASITEATTEGYFLGASI